MDETVHHLAVFVSRLWQIHVFAEGNTRTTAVFFIKYLRTLGFDVTNDIFAENAWYFRNALVRANYNDLKNGIHETTEFLELFLRNLLLGEKNALHNREMHISGKFGSNKKQDIEPEKQDIGHEEQDIHISTIYAGCVEGLSNKTIKNIEKVYGKLLGKEYFGRTDIVNILGITPSPASELIKKMLERQIICTVEGHGKGKYRFCDTGKN